MNPDEGIYPDLNVSTGRLKATVSFLTGIKPYRNHANAASLDRAAGYIERCFREYGLQTEKQYFKADGKTYANVLATLNPEKHERIVIGAHYDVSGDQPGADDNASGVAGLLEIARLLSIHGRHSKFRFDFAAYALEEPPFFATRMMGSHVHAKSLHAAKATVKGMLCLESIGYYSGKNESQHFPLGIMKLFYPRKGNFIAVIGNLKSGPFSREVKKQMRAAGIGVESLCAPSILPGVDFSDHRSFWAYRYPAVMITDTAFYRNPNYHTAADTLETLDFEKMEEAVKGIVSFLLHAKPISR